MFDPSKLLNMNQKLTKKPGLKSFDDSKVYLLQKQLRDLVAEAAEDEKEITDPETKKALQVTRELIGTLIQNVDKVMEQDRKKNDMRDLS